MDINPPQQERAKATRRKLLDAAVACLCSDGYTGTTTTTVARRAGVSQGALYKHFGSKHGLLAATTEHLLAGMVEDFGRSFMSGGPEQDLLSRVMQALWQVFLSPELYAAVELYMSARTDEALRLELAPVLEQHRTNLQRVAEQVFPQAAEENPRFRVAVDTALCTMQGAALSLAVVKNPPQAAEVAAFVEDICRRELLPPYGGS